MIVDAWIQHPSAAFLRAPMFASLRRWTGGEIPSEIPSAFTIGAIEGAGVSRALVSAWT